MYMKRVRQIAYLCVMAMMAVVLLSCSNESDTTLTSQQTSISRYLTSSHQPRLIAEADIASSLDSEPQFYTQWGLDIYRYIATYYAEGRDKKLAVEAGRKVALTYSAYVFTGSKPTISSLYATNRASDIEELTAAGLNAEYEWTTEPMVVTIGNDDIIPAVETALMGCREGDSVEIYLTYDVAYGKHYLGLVPSMSPIVWYIDIVSVKK